MHFVCRCFLHTLRERLEFKAVVPVEPGERHMKTLLCCTTALILLAVSAMAQNTDADRFSRTISQLPRSLSRHCSSATSSVAQFRTRW